MKVIDITRKELLGKTVYFMLNNFIIYGIVSGGDECQITVNKRYGISNNDEFFYTAEEILEYLEKNIIRAKGMK